MITISHESPKKIILIGSGSSFQQIAGMIRVGAQGDGASMRMAAQASIGDSRKLIPALLRIKVTQDPAKVIAIGKDLLVKGSVADIQKFCSALESAKVGDQMEFDVPSEDPRAVSVSVVLDEQAGANT